MWIKLASKGASATILPHRGALVSSLRLGQLAQEIFWLPQGFDDTASSWPGGGLPFLFPFAGRVWHQGELYRYKVGDRVYHMPLHGFSWATKWSVAEQHLDRAVLELRDDENSHAIFPFKFLIRLTISLSPSALKADVQIRHVAPISDAPDMPVALGWHPYFRRSAGPDQLVIPGRVIHPVTAQGGAGKPIPVDSALGPAPWALPHDVLKSLIISDLERPEARMRLGDRATTVTVTAGPGETMRHMVTWTNEPEAFHCVEPWMSLPDAVATPTGCRWLQGGETLNVWVQISL